jgi:lysophospholipase L1-like esterase
VTDGRPSVAKFRFLALGDSYTIGEAVEAAERWPVRLTELLRAGGIAIADPEIVAKTAWTTDELCDGIDAAHPRGPFDLVSLLIGVNNQYRGRSTSEYRDQLRGILARAVAFANDKPDRVIVLSIPDWGDTPFAAERDRARISREIDEFNGINRDETLRTGARYVDVTGISRRAAREPNLVAVDGLHPSAAMYDEWARIVLPVAASALRAPPLG